MYSETGDPDSHDRNVCTATNSSDSNTEVNIQFYTYNMTEHRVHDNNGTVRVYRNGSYSELATLFYGTGEQAVYHLYSKNTHKQFGYTSMAAMLVIYFVMSCWSAGTYLSCGIVVPMLLIGNTFNIYKRIESLSQTLNI